MVHGQKNTQKLECCVENTLPSDPVLSQMNPTIHLLKRILLSYIRTKEYVIVLARCSISLRVRFLR